MMLQTDHDIIIFGTYCLSLWYMQVPFVRTVCLCGRACQCHDYCETVRAEVHIGRALAAGRRQLACTSVCCAPSSKLRDSAGMGTRTVHARLCTARKYATFR
jgi:hypothetical protein